MLACVGFTNSILECKILVENESTMPAQMIIGKAYGYARIAGVSNIGYESAGLMRNPPCVALPPIVKLTPPPPLFLTSVRLMGAKWNGSPSGSGPFAALALASRMAVGLPVGLT